MFRTSVRWELKNFGNGGWALSFRIKMGLKILELGVSNLFGGSVPHDIPQYKKVTFLSRNFVLGI